LHVQEEYFLFTKQVLKWGHLKRGQALFSMYGMVLGFELRALHILGIHLLLEPLVLIALLVIFQIACCIFIWASIRP
jgi:hypothetical protein